MANRFIRALQKATANEPYKHRPRYWNARPVNQTSHGYEQTHESARRRRQIERGQLKAANGLEI